MFSPRVDRNDMLSFERAKLQSEMTKDRREHAEGLRRERLELKDRLDAQRYARKRAEEERKKKRQEKARRKKVLKQFVPHIPKKKRQGHALSRRSPIRLF